MGIGPVKTSTVGLTLPKYVGVPQPEADPTAQALQDLFKGDDLAGTESSTPAMPDDPFLALRMAVEGNNGLGIPTTQDFAPVQVPTVEELVAVDPTLVSFADGSVTELYQQLRTSLEARKAQFEAKIKQAIGTGAQIHILQQMVKQLDTALVQCDAEVAKVEALAEQATATYRQEVEELLPKALLGEITPEEADLNHDGYIGDPTNTEYLLGHQTIDGETTSAVLLKSTKKPVPFDPQTGLPLQGNVRDPNYEWTIAGQGIIPIDDPITDNDGDHIPTDLQLQLDAVGTSGNHFGAQIDIGVPEYIWVEADEKHPDKPAKNELGHYVVKPFDGLTQTKPTEEEADAWLQIRVTDLEVTSDKPVYTPNADWDPKIDGADHILLLKDKDRNIIMSIRIAGRPATELENNADAILQDHKEFVAASSVGLAFNGEQRHSGINFEVSDSFISTGRHWVPGLEDVTHTSIGDPLGASTKTTLGKSAQDSDDDRAELAKHDTIDRFTDREFDGEPGYSTGPNRTGVFVTGLWGNLQGSQYNDIFDIPPLTGEEAQYTTTVDAGSGYNAVIAKEGNHFIRGATFVDIQSSAYGDTNHIETPDQVKARWFDAEGNTQQLDPTVHSDGSIAGNPLVYVKVHTPGGQTVIDNSVEFGVDGDSTDGTPEPKDDYYDIEGSSSVSFTTPTDQDLPSIAFGQASPDDMASVFGENHSKIEKLILEETDTATEGEVEGPLWETGPDIYTEAVAKQNDFFSAWESAHGIAPDEDGAEGESVEEDIDAEFNG